MAALLRSKCRKSFLRYLRREESVCIRVTANTLCKSKFLAWSMVFATRSLRIHASINFIVNIFAGIHVETCVQERTIT